MMPGSGGCTFSLAYYQDRIFRFLLVLSRSFILSPFHDGWVPLLVHRIQQYYSDLKHEMYGPLPTAEEEERVAVAEASSCCSRVVYASPFVARDTASPGCFVWAMLSTSRLSQLSRMSCIFRHFSPPQSPKTGFNLYLVYTYGDPSVQNRAICVRVWHR